MGCFYPDPWQIEYSWEALKNALCSMEVSFTVRREMVGVLARAISCPPKKCLKHLFTVAARFMPKKRKLQKKKSRNKKKQLQAFLRFWILRFQKPTSKKNPSFPKRRPKGRFRSDSKKNENLDTAATVEIHVAFPG